MCRLETLGFLQQVTNLYIVLLLDERQYSGKIWRAIYFIQYTYFVTVQIFLHLASCMFAQNHDAITGLVVMDDGTVMC